MRTEEEIQRQTNATLNSLNGLTQLEANYFTYGQIMHRLERQTKAGEMINKTLLRVALVLLLLVGINFTTYALLTSTARNQPADISGFAGAYGLQEENYGY